MTNVPLFLPGLAISIAVGYAARRSAGRAIDATPLAAWVLLASAGTILSATLTPLRGALESGVVGTGGCDWSRVGPPPLDILLAVNDSSLNVVLFIPLGFAIGLVRSRRSVAWLTAGAAVAPILIETIQSALPVIGRGCESADVVDNVLGLLIGVIVGGAIQRAGHARSASNRVR